MRFGGAGVLRPARPLPPHSVPEWAIFLCVDSNFNERLHAKKKQRPTYVQQRQYPDMWFGWFTDSDTAKG